MQKWSSNKLDINGPSFFKKMESRKAWIRIVSRFINILGMLKHQPVEKADAYWSSKIGNLVFEILKNQTEFPQTYMQKCLN